MTAAHRFPLAFGLHPSEQSSRVGYVWAAVSSLVVTLAVMPVRQFADLADIVMLFMLAVVLVAARYGRRPAMAAAVLNVVAFDYFFVPPQFSFVVNDIQYVFTFTVMMVVGLVVGQLTAAMRSQALVANDGEQRALVHAEMTQALGNATSRLEALEIGRRTIASAFQVRATVLVPTPDQSLTPLDAQASTRASFDVGIAQWAFEASRAAGAGTSYWPVGPQLYLPLRAAARNEGVLVVEPDPPSWRRPERRRLLETFVELVTGAVERLHLLSVAHEAQVAVESERLRNSILAALSHDLRTPLTGLIGLSEMLRQALVREGSLHVRQVTAIEERLVATSALVANLLEMARLQAGSLALRRDWQSLDEIAESAARSVDHALTDHPLHVRLPDDFPLIHGDAVLLERVLANLFENAAKYTPVGTPITLAAWQDNDRIVVEVSDEGPGLLDGDLDVLFQTFERAAKESSTPGVGLGLSICRAIVHAHGGVIGARNRPLPEHGAILTWTLPFVAPPAVHDMTALAEDASLVVHPLAVSLSPE